MGTKPYLRLCMMAGLSLPTLSHASLYQEKRAAFDKSGYSLEHFETNVNFETCRKSETQLKACIAALEKAFRLAGAPIDLRHHEDLSFMRLFDSIYPYLEKSGHLSSSLVEVTNAYLRTRYDTHTRLESAQIITEQSKGEESFVDIGIEVQRVGDHYTISSVRKNSAAEDAGLSRGDQILEIREGGEVLPTEKLDYPTLRDALSGRPGSVVSIVIGADRKGIAQILKVTRPRAKLKTTEAQLIRHKNFTGGYLRVRSFIGPGVVNNVKKALENFRSKKAQAIVLDLRDNPGGSSSTALKISGMFLSATAESQHSPVYRIAQKTISYDNFDPPVRRAIQADTKFQAVIGRTMLSEETRICDAPVVILANERTASAAEVLAGALRQALDFNVLLIGERSAGKGTTQFITLQQGHPLASLDVDDVRPLAMEKQVLRFDTLAYNILSGEVALQLTGLRPDIPVDAYVGQKPEDKNFHREENYPHPLPRVGEEYEASAEKQVQVDKIRHCISQVDNVELGASADLQYEIAWRAAVCLARP